MMRRSVKITLIVSVLCLIVVAVGLLIFFTVFNRNIYHISGVEHLNYNVNDLKDSEMQLFDNGTFHVKIVHKNDGLLFLGIGTYTKSGDNYTFTFTEAVGKRENNLTNQMEKFAAPVTYTKSKGRIKFADHDSHIYYFG